MGASEIIDPDVIESCDKKTTTLKSMVKGFCRVYSGVQGAKAATLSTYPSGGGPPQLQIMLVASPRKSLQ